MKTHAAIAFSPDDPLRIEAVDLADPGPGEVRVRMQACGICRSDLSALEGKETVHFPVVLGHEGAGYVDAIGPGVTALKEGDEVVLSWTPACGTCAGCLRGEVHLCASVNMTTEGRGPLTFQGQPLDRFMALGAFSEHVVVPEKMAVPVQSGLAPTHSCLIGCGVTTGFGAAANTAGIRWGERVAVIGCGGVGLAAVQGARIAGARQIIAVDPIADRRDAAIALGATTAISPDNMRETIIEMSNGGVDAAIECVGESSVMAEAFMLIRPGGRCVVVGLPAYTDLLKIPAVMLLQEKTLTGSIYGSANPATDFQKIASLADSKQLLFEPLVDKIRPFSEINDGFEEMRSGASVRVVLSFD